MNVDEQIVLWIPGEPLSKARARVVSRGSYTPKTTRQAQDRVRVLARVGLGPPRKRGLPVPTVEALNVRMHFMRGHRARRDLDNMAKLVMDALEGVIWENDSQITELHLTQEYVKHSPGVLLLAERAADTAPAWVATAADQAGRIN